MKFINFLFIIFISLVPLVKADSNIDLITELKEGGKLVFIRHAYAPGSGDPDNFNLNDCNTQRVLNGQGKKQAKKIGNYFENNKILIDKVISSEWCRCKETALIGFENYETRNFLNSFFSSDFRKNKKKQLKELKKYVNEWQSEKNLILITHYVVISEALDYTPSSGEIIVSNKNFKKIGSIKIDY